jgi:hypothetical protein
VPQLFASVVRSVQPAEQHVLAPVHAGFPWQPQPVAMHESDVVLEHAWHAMAPVPHAVA